ncbi:MAG: hypothetical protein V4569_08250 [Pseudomonadota bacterium]
MSATPEFIAFFRRPTASSGAGAGAGGDGAGDGAGDAGAGAGGAGTGGAGDSALEPPPQALSPLAAPTAAINCCNAARRDALGKMPGSGGGMPSLVGS